MRIWTRFSPALAVGLLPSVAFAQGGGMRGEGYGPMWQGGMPYHDGWGWMMGMHGFMGLVLIGLLVLLAIGLFRGQGGRGSSQRRALDILEERYARGEIDRDEFVRRREDLG